MVLMEMLFFLSLCLRSALPDCLVSAVVQAAKWRCSLKRKITLLFKIHFRARHDDELVFVVFD